MWLGGNTLGSIRCPPGAQRVVIEKKNPNACQCQSSLRVLHKHDEHLHDLEWTIWGQLSSSQCPIVTTAANLMERKHRAQLIDVAAE